MYVLAISYLHKLCSHICVQHSDKRSRNEKQSDLNLFIKNIFELISIISSSPPKFHSKRVDIVYTDHANDVHEASLAPPIFLTLSELSKDQD